jgi:hypothetical protein
MTKKLAYELLPNEFDDIALVLMAGIEKGYEPDGWKKGVKFDLESNLASIKRHIRDFREGNLSDEESGLHPLLHAACRCLMQYYIDVQNPVAGKAEKEVTENLDKAFFKGQDNGRFKYTIDLENDEELWNSGDKHAPK